MKAKRTLYGSIAVLMLLLGGCVKTYKVHPGAANTFDSQAYDSLIIAKAGIDQTKIEMQTNPAIPKDEVNQAVAAYNAARAAYLVYHDAALNGASNLTQFQTDLQNALNALTAALGKVQQAKGVTP